MKKIILFFIFLFNVYLGNVLSWEPLYSRVDNNSVIDETPVVKVYPNPVKDYLYLKTSAPNVKVKSITFYSILGGVVAEMPINASYSEIKMDKLKPGKYFMRYTLDDNSQNIVQIIKQ